MYVIVVGAGDIGRQLIQVAIDGGHEVAVIEGDEDLAAATAEDFDCLVLHADATLQETLVEAGAGEADAIISTTDFDATNIMVCLLAKELEVPQLVSVVHRAEDIGVFRQIGVHVVENPQRLIAEYLFRTVSQPSVHDHMRIGEGAEIFQVEVTDEAPVAGMTLSEAAEEGILGDDVLVVAIDRPDDDQTLVPRGSTQVRAGDRVVVYALADAGDRAMAAFHSASA